MKLKQLLILGALLLSGSASAAIVDGVRQAPAMPAPIEAFTDGTTSMYMYNVGAGKFFCGGNAWGTQTSVSETGYRVYFEQYIAEGAEAWDGTTVYFKDSCLAKSGKMMNVFFDNATGGCFVDRGSQGNYWWKLEKNTDNAYYRLSMAEANPNYQDWQVLADSVGRTYWGWDSANGTVISSFLNPANEGIHVDWAFCTIPAYDAYQVELGVYNKAQELKALLDDVKGRGGDVSALETVYLNEASTIEEMEAAMETLRGMLDTLVDPKNPIDKSYLMTNANLDDGATGWTGSSPGVGNGTLEFYQANFDIYQEVTGLPNGVYGVSVQSYLRAGWAGEPTHSAYINGTEDNRAYIYATNGVDSLATGVPSVYAGASEVSLASGESEVTTADGQILYIPNNMACAAAYFADAEHGPKYKKTILISVTDGTLKVGATQSYNSAGYWFEMDNWELTYYGTTPEAYQMVLDNALPNAPKFEDDVVCTAGMIEAYNEAIAELQGTKVTNQEELAAAMAVINNGIIAIQENIALWKTFNEAVALGQETIVDDKLDAESDYVIALADYIEFEVEDILASMELDNEALLAEVDKILLLVDEAVKKGVLAGADVTKYYLVNPDFEHEEKGYGWTGSFTDVAGPANNKCMEAYEKNPFDIYQVVKGAPKGVYEISFNGFFRNGPNADAYAEYQALKEEGKTVEPQAWIYVNNNMTPMKNCYDEEVAVGTLYSAKEVYGPTPYVPAEDSTGYWYPNGMADAGTAFSMDMYRSYAYGIVMNDGDELRLGVKGNLGTYVWAIWDNFKMIFRGNKPDVIKPLLEEAIGNANANLAKRVGKEVRPMLNDAIAAGQAALGTGNGDEMFAALSGLFATNDTVNSSVSAFNEVYAYAETIFEAVAACENPTVVEEAMTLAVTITEGIDAEGGCTYATSEIAALNEQIALMLVKLNLPAGYENASDDNPVDMSKVLMNGDFGDAAGVASADGWQGTSGALGGDFGYEFYQKTFDFYQDLKGLPNGTYRVEVAAFARVGSSAGDYELFLAQADTTGAYLYATAGEKSATAPISLCGAGAISENLADGSTEVGNAIYVPNTMSSAIAWFSAGYYVNALHIEVTDGTLRIGMKKEAQGANDWVMMDGFKLIYLGTESKGIQDVVAADGQVVSVSVYGANGAQLNGMKKGLNIIRTVYANGAVKVKKVMVK